MFGRRSLGDSPLEHESTDVGLLDFIGRENEKSMMPVSITLSGVDHTIHREDKHSKTTVSYYLEEDLIKRVKALATLTERSYSSLAAEALRMILRQYGF